MSRPLPHTLICAVGTGLINRLASLPEDRYPDLRRALDRRDAGSVARELAGMGPSEAARGAEISSTQAMLDRRLVAENPHLHLCVSDTDDGGWIGQVLRDYFHNHRGWQVATHKIDGLQDADPQAFATRGLRNLVRAFAKVIRDAGGGACCAINATAGYKAMLGISVLVGQAMEVPVFYQHERFSRIIAVPPMPLSFDWDALARHGDLLMGLEESGEMELPADEVPELLKPFIDEIPAEKPGCVLCGLSPLGQTYLESFRLRHPPEKTLPPVAPADRRKEPRFRDDHYPTGFEDFVRRIWRETTYITTCHSLDFSGQKSIRHRRFYQDTEAPDRIVAEFKIGRAHV